MKAAFTLFVIIFVLGFSENIFCQPNVQKSSGKIEINTSKAAISKIDEWRKINSVSLYGGGSLLGLVTSSESIDEQTSPSGSVGLNFSSIRLSGNLYFSYNGKKTVDMMTLSQFGNSLMNPNLAGQSISFYLLGRITPHFGFSFSYLVTDNLWALDTIISVEASPVVARFGFYVRPFDFTALTTNEIDFTLNGHFAHRAIHGDFENDIYTIENQRISKRGYNGFDFSANIYLNSVQLFVQYSLNSEGDFKISGFTGKQISFGVNVTGDIIALMKKDE